MKNVFIFILNLPVFQISIPSPLHTTQDGSGLPDSSDQVSWFHSFIVWFYWTWTYYDLSESFLHLSGCFFLIPFNFPVTSARPFNSQTWLFLYFRRGEMARMVKTQNKLTVSVLLRPTWPPSEWLKSPFLPFLMLSLTFSMWPLLHLVVFWLVFKEVKVAGELKKPAQLTFICVLKVGSSLKRVDTCVSEAEASRKQSYCCILWGDVALARSLCGWWLSSWNWVIPRVIYRKTPNKCGT